MRHPRGMPNQSRASFEPYKALRAQPSIAPLQYSIIFLTSGRPQREIDKIRPRPLKILKHRGSVGRTIDARSRETCVTRVACQALGRALNRTGRCVHSLRSPLFHFPSFFLTLTDSHSTSPEGCYTVTDLLCSFSLQNPLSPTQIQPSPQCGPHH